VGELPIYNPDNRIIGYEDIVWSEVAMNKVVAAFKKTEEFALAVNEVFKFRNGF